MGGDRRWFKVDIATLNPLSVGEVVSVLAFGSSGLAKGNDLSTSFDCPNGGL
jgi:hypothetical protein